jgi:hypothetical protein
VEDGDFLRARRPQVFLKKLPAILVQILPLRGHHLIHVPPGFLPWIDPADRQVFDPSINRRSNVCGRIGGREMHIVATTGELDGDTCGDRRLTDSAFSERHHQALAIRLDLIDEQGERIDFYRRRGDAMIDLGVLVLAKEAAERRDAYEVVALQRHAICRIALQALRHGLECGVGAPLHRLCKRVIHVRGTEYAVDDDSLVRDAELLELTARPVASSSADASGRLTRMSVVRSPLFSASTAAAYCAC